MSITKIVSGGQTGADIGALEAAIYCEVPHGGWCPKGRKQEKGKRIPQKYGLTEMPTADYLKRTEANVVDSDATLIFTTGKLAGGSLKTQEFARKHGKPVLHIAINDVIPVKCLGMVCLWFEGEWDEPRPPKNCVLNVAGNRESKAPGIEQAVMARMIDIIGAVNNICLYPIREEGLVMPKPDGPEYGKK